jgi:hypothetical protein
MGRRDVERTERAGIPDEHDETAPTFGSGIGALVLPVPTLDLED